MASWLTVEEAATRVHRTPGTIRRWVRDDHLRSFNGLVMEKHLLDVDKAMRSNKGGRPTGQRVPLVSGGREVGYMIIGPDGVISGRMKP